MRKKKKVVLDDDTKFAINYFCFVHMKLLGYRKKIKALKPLHRIETAISNIADVIIDLERGVEIDYKELSKKDWYAEAA